jgi:hypothetical protein
VTSEQFIQAQVLEWVDDNTCSIQDGVGSRRSNDGVREERGTASTSPTLRISVHDRSQTRRHWMLRPIQVVRQRRERKRRESLIAITITTALPPMALPDRFTIPRIPEVSRISGISWVSRVSGISGISLTGVHRRTRRPLHMLSLPFPLYMLSLSPIVLPIPPRPFLPEPLVLLVRAPFQCPIPFPGISLPQISLANPFTLMLSLPITRPRRIPRPLLPFIHPLPFSVRSSFSFPVSHPISFIHITMLVVLVPRIIRMRWRMRHGCKASFALPPFAFTQFVLIQIRRVRQAVGRIVSLFGHESRDVCMTAQRPNIPH